MVISFNSRAFPSNRTRSEIDLRSEMTATLHGRYPEIPKGTMGLLRKMSRTAAGKLIPCDCVDFATGEGDRDTFCPVCLKGDSLIPTIHGVKTIRDIIPGEYVLGGDGEYHLVTDIHGRLYSGNIVKLFVLGRGGIPLELTSDHEVFIYRQYETCHQQVTLDKLCIPKLCGVAHCSRKKDQFVPRIQSIRADQVRPGDYVICPKYASPKECLTSLTIDWERFKTRKGKDPKPICNEIQIDEDLVRFVGWYVAEGSGDAPSRKSRTVVFTLHENERNIAEMLISISERKFGISGKIVPVRVGKAIKVEISNALLSRYMHELCGRYSDHKKVPEFIWQVNPALQKLFLDSFMQGDGHRNSQNWDTSGITSRILAEEIYTLAIHLGYFPSIWSIPERISPDGQRHSDCWFISWLNSQTLDPDTSPAKWRQRFVFDGSIFSLVKKVEINPEICAVYDISVQDVHNFIANGTLVHNCYGESNLWHESWITFYRVIRSNQSDFVEEEFRGPGTDKIELVNFYVEYDVDVTEADKIIEVEQDVDGNITLPYHRARIYRINSINPLRSDYGRLEYIKIKAVEEDVKYLNHPGRT